MKKLMNVAPVALFMFLLLGLQSCETGIFDDLPNDDSDDNENPFPGDDDEHDEECFEIIYPVDVVLLGDTLTDILSEDEIWAYLGDSTIVDIDSLDFPPPGDFIWEYVFPIEAQYPDGEIITINSGEELEQLYEDCFRDGHGDHDGEEDCPYGGDHDDDNEDDDEDSEVDICFEIVFPTDIIDTDGNSISVNNEEEAFDAVEPIVIDLANGSTTYAPNFAYPIDINLEDGTTQTIQDQDALVEAINNCNN